MKSRFERAIGLIDEKNSQDIHKEFDQSVEFPKELLYSKRMTKKLMEFKPDASEELQIATHAQHICRWKIPRNQYPMTRAGYIQWRETLKKMHAEITANILKMVGYNSEFIDRVSFLILKKLIKKDSESQVIEDVICLVFLEYYFEDFAAKHPDEKIIDILKKTWRKMSEKGRYAALNLKFSAKASALIKTAIG